jgi:hypothetical protein
LAGHLPGVTTVYSTLVDKGSIGRAATHFGFFQIGEQVNAREKS